MPVYIREYRELARERWGGPGVNIQAGLEKENETLDQTPVTVSGTSAPSAVFNGETTFVLVTTSEICHISTFGINPTATTNNLRLAAGASMFFGVPRNSGYKLAVIQGS